MEITKEQADKMIELLTELVDLSKGMHKELREIKVRTSEMSQ